MSTAPPIVQPSQVLIPSNEPVRKPGYPTDEEIDALLPHVELIACDGKNMDSDVHRMNMELLLGAVECHFQGRNDYYASGNSFIYFSTKQARNRDFNGPDFYFIKDVPREPLRDYWCVWEENGRYPNVIIELLSLTTRKEDLTTKKAVYEGTFRTGNYFCYDPDTQELVGWKLEISNGYIELKPNAAGCLWCDQLNLWLGVWDGPVKGFVRKWLRFFTPDGVVVPVSEEIAEAAVHKAEAAKSEAEAAKSEAEVAKSEAEAAKNEAEAAKAEIAVAVRRAEAAEAELARFRALLSGEGKPAT